MALLAWILSGSDLRSGPSSSDLTLIDESCSQGSVRNFYNSDYLKIHIRPYVDDAAGSRKNVGGSRK